MMNKRDNYALQAEDARLRFLGYDFDRILGITAAEADGVDLRIRFCGADYRVARSDGRLTRMTETGWVSADSHGEVLTLYDYLCDAKPGRAPAGEFVSMASLAGHLHSGLSGSSGPLERAIDADPEAFQRACLALGGRCASGGDACFTILLFPDLPVQLRFWHGDEDFPPALDLLWDRNALQFLRYETTWYAAGVLRRRISEEMGKSFFTK